jgi:nicotinamidase-related amidase
VSGGRQDLEAQNSALVVIDYQPSQVQTVSSIDHDVLIDNIVSVARLAPRRWMRCARATRSTQWSTP